MTYSRFSESPFRNPNLSEEQNRRIDERAEALRIYQTTGDPGPAQKMGLFPSSDRIRQKETEKTIKAAKRVVGQ